MSTRSKLGLLLGLALCAGSAGCLGAPVLEMPELAHARVAQDFHTYTIRRVGLMPFRGEDISPDRARSLQQGFLAELTASTPFEVLMLDERDIEEVEISEPYRRGWYKPRTIIKVSKRYQLDALLFGTVTAERFYPPLSLGLQVDMVSAETGLVIWSSSIHIDAKDPVVVDGLRLFYGDRGPHREEDEDWRLSLLSPERFGRFAAYQVACLL
jgi:hypothetical protein